jgi:hypothetical protein
MAKKCLKKNPTLADRALLPKKVLWIYLNSDKITSTTTAGGDLSIIKTVQGIVE